MTDIGNSLKIIRLEHNLTQKELATKLNVSYQTISKWELNKSLPSIEMLISISLLFDISIDSILFGPNRSKKNTIDFKNRRISMNIKNSKINHNQNINDLFNSKGTFISFYNQSHFSISDLSIHWLISLNDDNFLDILNKDSKTSYKLFCDDLKSVSFKLAKTFLGTAPGIFFSTKIILEIEFIFKEKNKHLILLSNSILIFQDFYKYFDKNNIIIQDIFNLKAELNNITETSMNE